MAKVKKVKLCTYCGEEKSPKDGFYLSRSSLYKENNGRLPICKECLLEQYQRYLDFYKDEYKAMYHLCMNFDIYFSKSLLESSLNNTNKNDGVLGAYIKNVNMKQWRNMTSLNSDHMILNEIVLNELEEKYKKKEIKKNKIKIPEMIKKRWGRGYSDEDYLFLEDTYQEFYDSYPHDTPAERLLLRQLSTTLLEGEICRRNGDRSGYEKMSKLVSSMLTDSNIKPSQKKNMGDEVGECFGVFIECVEKKEMIPDRVGVFEDVDGIGKYMNKHFVKNFAKIFGLDNNDDAN